MANDGGPVTVRFLAPAGELSRNGDTVSGFVHLWAVYVRGFNPRYHCQKCLVGPISNRVTTLGTPVDREIILDEGGEFRALYLCGIARGRIRDRAANNLHLPMQPHPGEHFEISSYNKYRIHIDNARPLAIPKLVDGWMGFPPAFSRCCNFRFGVSLFGI
jgi:hypothetical protein